jgi:hypothetical protein
MIRGRFIARRPTIDGLVSFGFTDALLDVRFLVDTGADVTLLDSVAYHRAGLVYDDFRQFPDATSSGFGGRIEARRVPARLRLLDADASSIITIVIELEVLNAARASSTSLDPVPALPSVLGRDVTDLFRLTIDRSMNHVTLEPRGDPNWRP